MHRVEAQDWGAPAPAPAPAPGGEPRDGGGGRRVGVDQVELSLLDETPERGDGALIAPVQHVARDRNLVDGVPVGLQLLDTAPRAGGELYLVALLQQRPGQRSDELHGGDGDGRDLQDSQLFLQDTSATFSRSRFDTSASVTSARRRCFSCDTRVAATVRAARNQ